MTLTRRFGVAWKFVQRRPQFLWGKTNLWTLFPAVSTGQRSTLGRLEKLQLT
ncbi:MAG: hypothetical protein ACI8Q6_004060 [Granulosicoccus sp.]|jgi:hypothetical protein